MSDPPTLAEIHGLDPDQFAYVEHVAERWGSPVGDMADAFAQAIGPSLDLAETFKRFAQSWVSAGHWLGLDRGRRLVEEHGGTPPLDRDERAAYWSRILSP